MTSVTEAKFTKQELSDLVKSSETCVTVERKTRILYVNPAQFYNISTGIHESLDILLFKYDFLFKAIILGYRKIKLLSKYGSFCYRSSKVALQIEADFYLFNPAVKSKLQGVVCKRSGHHLGCLVHKAFNVFIPIKEDDYMTGWDFSIGQEVTFTVVSLDLTSGPLPYIKGQLNVESEGADGDGNGILVGTDSGASREHEEEMGGWDSGLASSSPGKDTAESEEIDKYDSSCLTEESALENEMSIASTSKKKKSRNRVGEEMKSILKYKETSSDEETDMSKKCLDSENFVTFPKSFSEGEEAKGKSLSRNIEWESTENSRMSPEVPKKRKSILKSKQNSFSKNEETNEMNILETSFGMAQTEMSKKSLGSIVDSSSSTNNAVESEGLKEAFITDEGNADSSMVPIKNVKKRKSILKSKKEDPSDSEEMIKTLLKNMEMSFEEEHQSLKKRSVVTGKVLSSPGNNAKEIEGSTMDKAKQVNPEKVGGSPSVLAAKKRKSILKNKEDSPSYEELAKRLLKTMEMPSLEENVEKSKTDGMEKVGISSPGKSSTERKVTKEYDLKKMASEFAGGISPVTVAKSRKSILKNKKDSPSYEEVAKRLLKTMEMPCEEEIETSRMEETKKMVQIKDDPTIYTTQHSISPAKSKSRHSLDGVSKDSMMKKSRKSMSNTSLFIEKAETSPLKETLVKSDDSGKMSLASSKVISANEIEKYFSDKKDSLGMVEPSLKSSPKKEESVNEGKKKQRKSMSKTISVMEKVDVENEIEKLLAMNKKLLGMSDPDSEVFSMNEDKKGEKLAVKEKTNKKRKRESKDVTESPQRKKAAKGSSDSQET